MKLIFRLVLLAAAVGLGIWLWTVLFPSPEKMIRRQLTELAAKVSFSNSEGNLARLARAENVADFFATNVEVNIDVPGHEQNTFAGRDEITQTVLGSRQALSTLTVKFPDINVTVAPDKDSAVAEVTVEVTSSNDPDEFVQELKISFEKSGRQWLVNQIETVRTLSRPAVK